MVVGVVGALVVMGGALLGVRHHMAARRIAYEPVGGFYIQREDEAGNFTYEKPPAA
eukprot:contig_46214_g10160